MTAEEIRVRALVHMRTGEDSLLENIPKGFEVAGMYPENMGVDEFHTQQFRDMISLWPDVKAVVVRHGLMMDKEYLLCPYGSIPDMDIRFVAECMKNKDGDTLLGLATDWAEQGLIDLSKVGCHAKVAMKSNGLYATDLKFLTPVGPGAILEELMWRKMVKLRPVFKGIVNKKLRIVQECEVTGFYYKSLESIKNDIQTISTIKERNR